MSLRLVFIFLVVFVEAASGALYFIAPSGSNANPGTQALPFATLQKGHDVAIAGDTIFMRGGTYTFPAQTILTRDGTSAGSRISIFNYPGETPVIDAINQSAGATSSFTAVIQLNGASWWHIKGLELKNGPVQGIHTHTNSNNNIIEGNNIHHMGRLGANGQGTAIKIWGRHGGGGNHLILNNDVHDNEDRGSGATGGAANGIDISDSPGANFNVVRGNRAWCNSDDGIDMYNAAPAMIENNWVWDSGKGIECRATGGDGYGFKLGGNGPNDGGHTVRNNVTWDNKTDGMHENSGDLPMQIQNNTIWRNGRSCFFFRDSASTFRNNICHDALGPVIGSQTFNSWTLPVTVSDADFVTLDKSCVFGARQANGDLPVCTFLHLVPSSDLVNKGTNVGIPFSGSAPDLGAFETGGVAAPTDTVPPTVSLTAPTNGATVSGSSVTVSATASDAVGVFGVRFLVDGAALGVEDTSFPYSVTWNTTTASEGAHSLNAVARDAANNQTTSATFNVTVDNVAPPSNLPISHWRFDEASGTAIDSIASSSNHLTLTGGAAFAAGQIGNALSLNGTTAFATDASTTALNISSAMTISAWIRATSLPAGSTANVFIKAPTSGFTRGYGLTIVDNKLTFAKVGVQNINSSVTVPVGSFHHVAATWSFAAGEVKFYLDGALAETVANPGVAVAISPPVDADPVLVGKASNGLPFNGLVDDLRIYNRALTAPEIAAIGTPAPDDTPPTVALTAPANGATVSGPVTISANATDAGVVAGVQFKLDGANLGAEDTTAPYSISWNSAIATDGSHQLGAVARDGGGATGSAATRTVTVNNADVCP